MSTAQVLTMLGAVLIAATAQQTAGFGFSLLGVPLMALSLETHDAVVIATWLGLLSSGVQAVEGRPLAHWATVRRLVIGTLVGIPFGLLVFTKVDEGVLKIVLGASVLVATVVLARDFRLTRPGSAPEWLAGIVSGALAASLSTNGPPLVFVLQARRMGIAEFRATLNQVFVVANVAALLGFAITGELSAHASSWAMAGVPVVGLGLLAGRRLRPLVGEVHGRRVVLVLLALAGTSAIVTAL